MEKLQKVMQEKNVSWINFDTPKKCKEYLISLKHLGYKWVNGKEISNKETLNFYFTLEVDSTNKTVGFVPNFQRFAKKKKD